MPGVFCSVGTPPQEKKCSIQEHASLLPIQRFIVFAEARKELLLPSRQVCSALQHLQRFMPYFFFIFLSSLRAQVGAHDLQACEAPWRKKMHAFGLSSHHSNAINVCLECIALHENQFYLEQQRQPAAACNHFLNQHRRGPERAAQFEGPSLKKLRIIALRK